MNVAARDSGSNRYLIMPVRNIGRQKNRQRGHRSGQNRAGDFLGSFAGGIEWRLSHALVANDVLDHHDPRIDDRADRQRDPAQVITLMV